MIHPQYIIPAFDYGMVPSYPMTILPQTPEGGEGFTNLLYNFNFGRVPGQMSKRPGTAEVLGVTANPILGLYEYTKTDTGDKYLLAANGAVVQRWNPATSAWVDVRTGLTAGQTYDFLTFTNQVAVVNGANASFLWDGTTVITPTDFPKAKYLAEFRLRIVAAGDPDNPLELSLSHPGDAAIWDPEATGSRAAKFFISPDDGQIITGVLSLEDFILVGKSTNLYGIYGTTLESLAVFPLNRNIGVGSHWALKDVGGVAYFPDVNGDIFKYEPGEPINRISDAVQDLIDLVDKDNIDKARATVLHGELYLISLPIADNNRVTLVYDTIRSRWLQWSIEVGEMTHVSNDSAGSLYFTAPGGTQISRLTPKTYTDGSNTPITTIMESVVTHFGFPGIEKEIHKMFIRFKKTSVETNLTFSYKLDNRDWSRGITLNIPEGNNGYVTMDIPIGVTCREFEYRLSHAGETDFKLLDAAITYTPKEVD